MKLRDYQQDLLAQVFEAFNQHRRVMLQLPTGAGKTVLFSAIANELISLGYKVLVLAHRTELILQAADKLATVTGSPIGIIKAGIKPNYQAPIQVASVQSLKRRLHHLNPEEFGLVVIDEAHHSTAATYRHALDRFNAAYQLGCTATPIRTDGTGFNDLFDTLICGPTIKDLIAGNYLSKFKLYASANPMATKGARTKQGDFVSKDIAKLNPVVELAGDLIQSYRQYANGKSCLVFCVNVAHSKAIAQRYCDAGISAAHLDGTTPKEERAEILAKFRQGQIKVITNCALFTEGLDVPSLEVVQIAKPTQSLSLWLQINGRVLRIFEGKEHAIILDHTNGHAIHGLPTRRRLWSLYGVEQENKVIKRRPNGEVVEEQEPVVIEEAPAQLVEVVEEDPTEDQWWLQWWLEQLHTQRLRNFKKGWLYHKLVEAKPPLFIWEQAAIAFGYRNGWAWHSYRQHCLGEAV